MIDCVVINAWIAHSHLHAKAKGRQVEPPRDQLAFRLALSNELLQAFTVRLRAGRPRILPAPQRYDGLNHWQMRYADGNRKQCTQKRCEAKTRFYCSKCNVPLCLPSEGGGCFLAYHTQ
jgi:hypothetical protein